MAGDELRTERLEIRLSPAEKDNLLKLADMAGMSVAAAVRALCTTKGAALSGSHGADGWARVRDYSQYMAGVRELSAGVAKTRTELHRIGVNVNQIARSLNSGRSAGITDLTSLEIVGCDLRRGMDALAKLDEAADTLAKSYERLGDE